MKIKFLGAAGTVTGSKYLLTTNSNKKYLIDCGLFQGLKELRKRNWSSFDLDTDEISAVLLTHAHIDHTGFTPRLINMGFNGHIYCSRGTYELSKILLPDSGYLQEEEARFANKKGYSKHRPALPLYTREDAENALNFFKPVAFHQRIKLDNNSFVTFYKAGHILGASSILIESDGRKIIFSGDVGRFNDLIMLPPEPLVDADYLVIESTYGDREHPKEDVQKLLADIINETIKKNGVILVPAFAVGRAQHILYLISKLKAAKKIPDIDVYLDSPMAINATELYCAYHAEHKLSADDCSAMCGSAKLTKTSEESKSINKSPGSKLIISASGMASGGRILHHLSHYLSHKENAVVIVGFQAAGTRGRAMLDGAERVKIFGDEYEIKARIEYLSSLSAHADSNELIKWLRNSPIKNPKVFVTHGESSSAETFKSKIEETFSWQVHVPEDREEIDL